MSVNLRKTAVVFPALLSLAVTLPALAEAAQVTGRASVTQAKLGKDNPPGVSVVFWLTPLSEQPSSRPQDQSETPHSQLIQKNKVFIPHIMVVQVGSQVDFPNHDPFFHNVFSLFNGKRFDLGLYEAGSTRGVRFDRAGICYIFCNIHPQMSAVVVVVDTPYFAMSNAKGEVSILRVPPGRYQLNVWEEHCAPKDLEALSHPITVGENDTSLGNLHLRESVEPAVAHLNKYGKPYDPEVFPSPIYVKP